MEYVQYDGGGTNRGRTRRRTRGRRTRRTRKRSQRKILEGGVGEDGRVFGDMRKSLSRGIAGAKGDIGKFRAKTTIGEERRGAATINRDLKARSYKCKQSKSELMRLKASLEKISELGKESAEFCQPEGTPEGKGVWQLGNFKERIDSAVKPLTKVLKELEDGMNRHVDLGSKEKQLEMVEKYNKLEAKLDRMTNDLPNKINDKNKELLVTLMGSGYLETRKGKWFLEQALIGYHGILQQYRDEQGLSEMNAPAAADPAVVAVAATDVPSVVAAETDVPSVVAAATQAAAGTANKQTLNLQAAPGAEGGVQPPKYS